MTGTTTSQQPDAAPTRRERQREATLAEIRVVARGLLKEPAGLSLRGVAQAMGMTAPALYRYVGSYQELVLLVSADIDSDQALAYEQDRSRYPDDDPAAQIVAAAVSFRRWALRSPEEFALVFANPLTAKALLERPESAMSPSGLFFNGMLTAVWEKYHFPFPAEDELDPDVRQALLHPFSDAIPCQFPREVLGLGWVFMQSWAILYGTVTLEVFGHLDPQIIATGAMFRSMLERQSETLGFSHELPRLRKVLAAEAARV